jgi:hypothetical protein
MPEQSLSLSESVSLSDNRIGAEVITTCPLLNETRVPLDLTAMGCRPFLERTEQMQAQRMPGPRIDPMKYRAHEIPLEVPLPNPEGLVFKHGMPPPDRGQTLPWPHEQNPDDET